MADRRYRQRATRRPITLIRRKLATREKRGVLCRASRNPLSGRKEERGNRGVSDPPARARSRPRPRHRGSLTPRLHDGSVREDTARARVDTGHRARRWNWPPARRAPRLETVTTAVATVSSGRDPCRSSSRAARQAAREAPDTSRSREQRDALCHVHFLGESVGYVLNQLIDCVSPETRIRPMAGREWSSFLPGVRPRNGGRAGTPRRAHRHVSAAPGAPATAAVSR